MVRQILNFLFLERERYFLWVPFFFSLGIGFYFGHPTDPCAPFILIMSALFLVFTISLFSAKLRLFSFPFWWIILGYLLCIVHATFFTVTPLRHARFIKNGIAKVAEVHFRPSGRQLILKIPWSSNPLTVKLALRGHDALPLAPGDIIQSDLMLTPIPPPGFPHGFHYRRKAAFSRLSAWGFVASRPRKIISSPSPFYISIAALRQNITQVLLQDMPHLEATIAAALLTGHTSLLTSDVRDMFAQCGIAHILAISGLHFNMLLLFILALMRLLLSGFPFLLARLNIFKISGLIAWPFLLFYVLLAGAAVPAQRAFIMTTGLIIALLSNRVTLSLRMVAFAFCILVALNPMSLLTPSFQLSFAAVTELIFLFEYMRSRRAARKIYVRRSFFMRAFLYCLTILLTSFFITILLIPFTLFHFSQVNLTGFITNFIAIPLMTFWIMPFLFIGAILMPVGWELLPFQWAAWGIKILLQVAQYISTWPGTVIYLSPPSATLLVVWIVAMLWFICWKKAWRYWALPFIVGCYFCFFIPRHTHLYLSVDSADTRHKPSLRLGIIYGDNLYVNMGRGNFLTRQWAKAAGISPYKIFPWKKIAKTIRLQSLSETTTFTLQDKTITICHANFSPHRPYPHSNVILNFSSPHPPFFRCPQTTLCLDKEAIEKNAPFSFRLKPSPIKIWSAGQQYGKRFWDLGA